MAKRGRLTPETLSQFTESRPTTGVSTKSRKRDSLGGSGGEEEDEVEEDDDEQEIGELASLPGRCVFLSIYRTNLETGWICGCI